MRYKSNIYFNVFIYTVAVIGALVLFYPFAVMVINSIKPGPEIIFNPTQFPSKFVFTGYAQMWGSLNLIKIFKNSFIVAISITFLNLFFDSLVGYSLAKLEFPGKEFIFRAILATMMIPFILLIVPTYLIIHKLGWVNQYKALIIPGAVNVFSIFLIRQFISQIPDDLLNAARVDGCSELGVYFRIILPTSKPVLVMVTIFMFMTSWNDFFLPLLYLRDMDMWTVQLALNFFRRSLPTANLEQIYAAMTVITLPLLIVYFALQRQFIQAFTHVELK